MRFTESRWLVATKTAFLLLLAATSASATKRPQYGGTLRIELHLPTASLDPRVWTSGSMFTAQDEKLAALIYDRLVTLDEYGRFQSALAIEWSHDASLKNWQFRLRPGVKFSDGTALTPKEVVAALQPLLPTGLQVSATENGVAIHSSRAIPDLLEQLASGRYFIFRAQSEGAFFGTGPFILAENVPSTPSEANPSALKPAHLKFRANEECWSGRPFLEAIEVTLGQPPLRGILNLQVGRDDIVEIPADLVRKARQDNLRVWSSPPDTLLGLRFDEDAQPAASNVHLREALDVALDRDTMANVLLQKQALPATAFLPQWLSGYAFVFGNPMNLERAKEIRTVLPAGIAGGADPLRLRVEATGDLMKLLGERVAVNARQANLSIQVVSRGPSSGSPGAASSLGAGLRLFVWHYESLSARTELQSLARYLHAETSVQAAAETTDPEKLCAEERRLLDERQLLPLLLLPEYVGIAPNVRNWSAAPSGEWRLADVWLDSSEPAAHDSEAAAGGGHAAVGVHP
jgi:peptide/nickel transport system substrate-binding protein